MRDSPLTLNVVWGKSKAACFPFEKAKSERAPRAPQKKEKPRRNGASRGDKQ